MAEWYLFAAVVEHGGFAYDANVAGFTAEGFFLVKTGYSAAENGGLGIGHGGPGVGMIRIPRGTGTGSLPEFQTITRSSPR